MVIAEATTSYTMADFEHDLNLDFGHVNILGTRIPAGSALRRADPPEFERRYMECILSLAGDMINDPSKVETMRYGSPNRRR